MIDLQEIGFTFAVEQIGPEVGTIKASQIDWSGIDGQRVETDVELEACDILGPQELSLNNEFTRARIREDTEYLCPTKESQMQI